LNTKSPENPSFSFKGTRPQDPPPAYVPGLKFRTLEHVRIKKELGSIQQKVTKANEDKSQAFFVFLIFLSEHDSPKRKSRSGWTPFQLIRDSE